MKDILGYSSIILGFFIIMSITLLFDVEDLGTTLMMILYVIGTSSIGLGFWIFRDEV